MRTFAGTLLFAASAAETDRFFGNLLGLFVWPLVAMAVCAKFRQRRTPQLSMKEAMFTGWPLWVGVGLLVLVLVIMMPWILERVPD